MESDTVNRSVGDSLLAALRDDVQPPSPDERALEVLLDKKSANLARRALRESGWSLDEVEAVFDRLAQNPLLRLAIRKTYSACRSAGLLRLLHVIEPQQSTAIPVREFLSRDEFESEFYSKNRPVIVRAAASSWKIARTLTWEYLEDQFGDVLIQYSSEPPPRTYNSRRSYSTLREFLRVIQSSGESSSYLVANDKAFVNPKLRPLIEMLGTLPFISGFDRYTSGANLWIGPEGAFTPVHHDSANNILVQIRGRKRLRMWPAKLIPAMYSDRPGWFYAEHDLAPNDRVPDEHWGPSPRWAEGEIGPTDIAFIPAAWSHEVRSETAAISVNINFSLKDGIDQLEEVMSW